MLDTVLFSVNVLFQTTSITLPFFMIKIKMNKIFWYRCLELFLTNSESIEQNKILMFIQAFLSKCCSHSGDSKICPYRQVDDFSHINTYTTKTQSEMLSLMYDLLTPFHNFAYNYELPLIHDHHILDFLMPLFIIFKDSKNRSLLKRMIGKEDIVKPFFQLIGKSGKILHYQTPRDFEDWWKKDFERRINILLQVQSVISSLSIEEDMRELTMDCVSKK